MDFPPVSELGTILSVWAHPDDETYCCAGLMAAAVQGGQRVVCVTATRGELGSTDPERWPPGPGLAAIRTAELEACLVELHLPEHHWLDYPDGGCAEADAETAVARIRAIAEEVRPDTVLTFGPDGGTFHPDHIAVSAWTTEAVRHLPAALHYATSTPQWVETMAQYIDPALVMMADADPVSHTIDQLSIYTELTGAALDQKYRAMLCQQSQVGPLLSLLGPENYRRMLAEEPFRSAASTRL